MTQVEFRRWYTFAIRMAHRGFPTLPHKSRKRVAHMVKEVIRAIAAEHPVEDIGDFDGYLLVDGKLVDLPCIVGDWELTQEERFNPHYDEDGESYRGRSARNEAWYDRWWIRVHCCLRAGVDLAVQPSVGGGGVLGFEICDLRRMYRGNIPQWINDGRWVNGKGEQDMPDLNQGNCQVGIWL